MRSEGWLQVTHVEGVRGIRGEGDKRWGMRSEE